jgi:hypothetical protein
MSSTGLFWLSFADSTLPPGTQFLGAAVVRAKAIIEAIQVAHAIGINPGGEVQGHPIVYEPGIKPIPDSYIERLLDRPTIDQLLKEVGA